MKKVVINTCYGGFDLSDEAKLLYVKKKYPNKEIEVKTDKFGFKNLYVDNKEVPIHMWDDSLREDPLLIEIIEELGDKANTTYSDLKIVEIPNNVKYTIEEYDGRESIEEAHWSWS